MADLQLCTFRLAELLVGIDVHLVREVLADPDVTPVPLAPPGIAGLLNLRGQILTVVDGRARLGFATDASAGRTHVIVDDGGELMSMVVDRDDDVIDIDDDDLEEVPTTVGESIRTCATGAYKLDGELLVVLDVDAVFNPEGST